MEKICPNCKTNQVRESIVPFLLNKNFHCHKCESLLCFSVDSRLYIFYFSTLFIFGFILGFTKFEYLLLNLLLILSTVAVIWAWFENSGIKISEQKVILNKVAPIPLKNYVMLMFVIAVIIFKIYSPADRKPASVIISGPDEIDNP